MCVGLTVCVRDCVCVCVCVCVGGYVYVGQFIGRLCYTVREFE